VHLIAGLVLLAVAAAPVPQASGAAAAAGRESRAAALVAEGMELRPALARSGDPDEVHRHMNQPRHLAAALVATDAQ
jgi:hypothetical protein